MAYYLRVFCTNGDPPVLRDLLEFAAERGTPLTIDPEAAAAIDTDRLSSVDVRYKADKGPLVIELNRDTGPDSLAHEEVAEFLELVEDARNDERRRQVEQHLRATTFIVAEQLLGDIDDDGYNAAGNVLNFFVERHGGMIQSDGEGFYDGQDVILDLT